MTQSDGEKEEKMFFGWGRKMGDGGERKMCPGTGVTAWSDFERWWSPSQSRCFCTKATLTIKFSQQE